MQKLVSLVVTCALIVSPSLALAAGPASPASPVTPVTGGLLAAAARAAQRETLAPLPMAQQTARQSFPRSLPRSGRRFNQGGGGAGMMVMSLIGTVAGVAGTYYMVKMMRDQNKEDAR